MNANRQTGMSFESTKKVFLSMPASHAATIDSNAALVHTNCQICNTEHIFTIPTVDYFLWQSGKSIQDACPYINRDSAEILISGICSDCFDSLFSGEDE